MFSRANLLFGPFSETRDAFAAEMVASGGALESRYAFD
jgi:hypothetical protein